MIKSAVLKLTLYYLALVMGLSLGFSFFLYHVSSSQLNRSLRRPDYGIVLGPGFDDFRQTRLSEAEASLLLNFVIFNLLVLVLGGFVCYALAQKTLQPIKGALEAQSRFTADASHELRTPLTAMQTEIEVALRQPKLRAVKSRALLESNLEEITKLRTLSESLLKLARQDTSALEYKQVSLEGIAIEAVSSITSVAQAKKIAITNNVQPTVVQVDATVIKEVLSILIQNAVQYSPENTAITLSSTTKGSNAYIMVADQGPGIATKDLPHIFERFYRGDESRTKTDQDGYGLGLSIAKQLLRLHGGSLTVKNLPKKGAQFTIELPLARSK